MKTPPVKTLKEIFPEPGQAKTAEKILTSLKRSEILNFVKSDEERERLKTAPTYRIRMQALNDLGEFAGVESAELEKGGHATYLNAGDTYVATLIRFNGKYRVNDLGTFVETMERRGIKFK